MQYTALGLDICGIKLKESKIRERCGLLIIAIKKRGEALYTYNPSASERIEENDALVALGYREQILELKGLAGTN